MEHEEDRPARFRRLRFFTWVCILACLAALGALYEGYTFGNFGSDAAREPLTAHLILTAVTLALGLYFLRPDDKFSIQQTLIKLSARMSAGAMGAVNACLAAVALFTFDPDHFWVVAFAAPALVGIWMFLGSSGEKEEDQKEKPENSDDTGARFGAISLPQPQKSLRAFFLYGLYLALVFFVYMTLLFTGIAWFMVIKTALMDNYFAGWSAFFNSLKENALEYFLITIIIPVIYLIFFSVWGVWKALFDVRDINRYHDVTRDLTEEEHALIADCYAKMKTYVEDRPHSVWPKAAYWISLTGFVIVMLCGLGFTLLTDGVGSALFEASRTQGLEWYIYYDEYGAAEVMVLFSLIFVYWSAVMWVGVFWKSFGEWGYFSSINSNQKTNDVMPKLGEMIARDVRRRKITSKDDFDPAAYIAGANLRSTQILTKVSIVVLAVNGLLWVFDRMDYAVVSNEGIVYTDYWTFGRHKAGYDEIEKIESECYLDSEDDLFLTYKFILMNGHHIGIVQYSTPIEFKQKLLPLLDRWIEADSLARKEGALVEYREFKDKVRFDPQICKEELSEYYEPDVVEKVLNLVRE